MALSAVYKEARFHDEVMDVCWLTQWVSIYQLLFGFVLMPLQMLPGVGTAGGMSPREIGDAFASGWDCCLQAAHSGCAPRHTSALLFSYAVAAPPRAPPRAPPSAAHLP